jgi:3-mercaptopyruvate sulfurtransferase SseA
MFGSSVSLSDDGKTLAVGAYLNGEFAGHIRIYRLDGGFGSWQQLGQDIDGEEPCDNSGYSLSLSADGMTVAIGALYNSANGEYTGHVKVY